MVTALLILGVLALGIMAFLGWTADSRDDAQTLWPLERTVPHHPMVVPARPGSRTPRPRQGAPQPSCEPINRPMTRR